MNIFDKRAANTIPYPAKEVEKLSGKDTQSRISGLFLTPSCWKQTMTTRLSTSGVLRNGTS